MHALVNAWLINVQAVLLPPYCVLCGGAGQRPVLDLCEPCAAELPWNRVACARCAAPLPAGTPAGSLCGDCLRRPPRFARALVPFHYAYPLDRLVKDFKYHGRLAYGRVLGTLCVQHLRAHAGPLPELLVPVPLHPARHRERGFNQSGEIARHVAATLGIALDERLCRRARATVDQTTLSARERRQNLRGAFVLERKPAARHIAILDDVLTTGSTANELARTLLRGGVKQVSVWAVARATPVHSANR
ncbi:MAG TPA: ComF family protein [Steroidobacteraceae bacterium]|nr:ComF family protein [Steroidobacteraceae bacterium]